MSVDPYESDYEYEVFLTDDAVPDAVAVSSPLRTPRLDYYDTGVWVHPADPDENERLFFPYERILVIREHSPSDDEGEVEIQ